MSIKLLFGGEKVICESKFKVGDKVTVTKNTERTIWEGRIGMTGRVVDTLFRDCFVEFADGTTHAIFEEDLELADGQTKKWYNISADGGQTWTRQTLYENEVEPHTAKGWIVVPIK